MIFTHPKMEFEKVSNGWKVSMDVHPFRAHYIKLDGIHPTGWMLDHVECIKPNMQEYLDFSLYEYAMFSGKTINQKTEFVEHSG